MDLERDDDAGASSAASASSATLARNAASFSSALSCPPTAVFTIGSPYAAAQRTALIPCSSPSRVVRSECPLRLTACEAVAGDAAPHLGRIAVEIDVLGPARHGRQLDVAEACPGDARERLVEAVGVVRVRVTCEGVRHRVLRMRSKRRRPARQAPLRRLPLDVGVARVDLLEGRVQLERLRVGDRRRLVGLLVGRDDQRVRVDGGGGQPLLRLPELVDDARGSRPPGRDVPAPALTVAIRGAVCLGQLDERVVGRLRLQRLLERRPRGVGDLRGRARVRLARTRDP